VTRRPLTILLPLAAASLLAAGCTTFTDDNVIARVDDAELRQEQIDELLPLVSPDVSSEAQAGAIRTAISVWIEAQVFSQAVSDAGIELDDTAIDDTNTRLSGQFPTFSEISAETRDLLVEYVTGLDQLPALPRPSQADTRRWFDGGPQVSGVACVTHILVDTEAEADEIIDELAAAQTEGGEEAEAAAFAALAAERSTDPGSGANGGFLTCDVTDAISTQFVPPFAEGTLAAMPGEPTEPIESDFGFHVIRLNTYDESVADLEAYFASGYVQARIAIDSADVYVNPRYGTAEGINVVPLG
jgi:parvulin-like peptidyl-prolyl isomerase